MIIASQAAAVASNARLELLSLSRRDVINGAMSYGVRPLLHAPGQKRPNDVGLSESSWADIRSKAAAYIADERQGSKRPFKAWQGGAVPGRVVLIDYFPAMPLSLDNKPLADDVWAQAYLSPDGSRRRFVGVGGYVEERPISPGAWDSPQWERINLAIDVLRAADTGADGFIVDILRFAPALGWQRVKMLYEVAAQVAPAFRIVPCIDHAALTNVSAADIVTALAALYGLPATFRLPDGRVFVTAFAPEKRGAELWSRVIDGLRTRGMAIAFMPIFLNIATAASFTDMSYGFSVWGERDPVSVSQSEVKKQLNTLMPALWPWMEPVAPQDARPKANFFWEAHGADLFTQQWHQAIDRRAQFIHVITWNDFSESTAVEPATGHQFVFYDLLTYYTALYKSGAVPLITGDAIYYLQRKQLVRPDQVRVGGPFRLMGKTSLKNDVEVIAFLKAPALISVTIGATSVQKQGERGLNIVSVSATIGRPIFNLIRDGTQVLSLASEWPIAPAAALPIPLYVGGSTTRVFSR